MDNGQIADRLDAFAVLLELSDANPYTTRAYRRAAAGIRVTPAPIAELVRAGRVRELRGVGSGIELRLRELLETGEIAELAALERELSPGLVGLGRYLGLTANRAVELARALDVRTAEQFREAAAAGRLRDVPGIGPKTEARVLEALRREAEPRRPQGLLLDRATDLVAGVASLLGGEAAGDVRRRRDLCEHLCVVCGATELAVALDRFAELPQIVAIIERADRRALGVTVEGVPIELLVAPPARFGTELLRATGATSYVSALEPLPERPDEASVYAALGIPWCPPELRERPFRGEPPPLVGRHDIRGDLHCHSTWSDGRASIDEMGRAARERGYEYLAICDHTPAVGAVQGLDPGGGRAGGRGRGQRAGTAFGPQWRARARRPAGGRADRLLDRCALGHRAGEHGVVGGHRTTGMGDRRGRGQHAIAPGPALLGPSVGPRAVTDTQKMISLRHHFLSGSSRGGIMSQDVQPYRPPEATPVGHSGSRLEIGERPAWAINGWIGVLVVAVCVAAVLVLAGTSIPGLAAVPGVVGVVIATSLVIVQPGHTKVVRFFGTYVGTVRRTGLWWVVPLADRRSLSIRVRNFETNHLKVNDADGNPVEIACIVVWQVADTSRGVYAVDDYVNFIEVQAESALRHVATTHPYDDPAGEGTSLRGSTDVVAGELAEEVAQRVAIAGVEIVEVRISHLAYASEIAQAMLRRQQANAVVAARSRIVDGAVGMVQLALSRLDEEGIVELDEERKAAMVSNLLVVLCGDQPASPVVNTGSLYT